MSNKLHDTLVLRLSDILIRLNLGERLDVKKLAEDYGVSLRTIRRDLKERFACLRWLEEGPQYYALNTIELGQFTSADMASIFAFLGVDGLLPPPPPEEV